MFGNGLHNSLNGTEISGFLGIPQAASDTGYERGAVCSALGAAGEIFLVAGSLLGLDSYFDFKLKRYLGKNGNEQ